MSMSVKIEVLDVHKLHGVASRAKPMVEAVGFYGIFNAKSLLKFVQYYEKLGHIVYQIKI